MYRQQRFPRNFLLFALLIFLGVGLLAFLPFFQFTRSAGAQNAAPSATLNPDELTQANIIFRQTLAAEPTATPEGTATPALDDAVPLIVSYDETSLTILIKQPGIVSLKDSEIYVHDVDQSRHLEAIFGDLSQLSAPVCLYMSLEGKGKPASDCADMHPTVRSASIRDIIWHDPNINFFYSVQIRRGDDTPMGDCPNPNQDCPVIYVPIVDHTQPPPANILQVDAQLGRAQPSNVSVQTGQQFTISAQGLIVAGPYVGQADPNGLLNALWDNEYTRESYNVDVQYPHASLLVRIQGETKWAYCGCRDGRTFTSTRDGLIEFIVNDKGTSDDEGEFTVTINLGS